MVFRCYISYLTHAYVAYSFIVGGKHQQKKHSPSSVETNKQAKQTCKNLPPAHWSNCRSAHRRRLWDQTWTRQEYRSKTHMDFVFHNWFVSESILKLRYSDLSIRKYMFLAKQHGKWCGGGPHSRRCWRLIVPAFCWRLGGWEFSLGCIWLPCEKNKNNQIWLETTWNNHFEMICK